MELASTRLCSLSMLSSKGAEGSSNKCSVSLMEEERDGVREPPLSVSDVWPITLMGERGRMGGVQVDEGAASKARVGRELGIVMCVCVVWSVWKSAEKAKVWIIEKAN